MSKKPYEAPEVLELGLVKDLTSQTGKQAGSGDCFTFSQDTLTPCEED